MQHAEHAEHGVRGDQDGETTLAGALGDPYDTLGQLADVLRRYGEVVDLPQIEQLGRSRGTRATRSAPVSTPLPRVTTTPFGSTVRESGIAAQFPRTALRTFSRAPGTSVPA